jgi:hypothetical protein
MINVRRGTISRPATLIDTRAKIEECVERIVNTWAMVWMNGSFTSYRLIYTRREQGVPNRNIGLGRQTGLVGIDRYCASGPSTSRPQDQASSREIRLEIVVTTVHYWCRVVKAFARVIPVL